MNIETLIVINKCLRRTKIPLVLHLKTMFVTTTWKTVKFAPQREPLDKKSLSVKYHLLPCIYCHIIDRGYALVSLNILYDVIDVIVRDIRPKLTKNDIFSHNRRFVFI